MRLVPLVALVLFACKEDPPSIPTPSCILGFADRDGDGFGNALLETSDCQEPVVDNADDCDDTLTAVNPDAQEVCDERDNNCDGLTDLDDPTLAGAEQWIDQDEDGYGAGEPVLLCEPIPGWVDNDLDCDDAVLEISPDAQEVCGGGDEDCDGLVDEEDDTLDETTLGVFFEDADGDTFGSTVEVLACEQPEGTVFNDVDCDDNEASTYPDAPERCNARDSDCDGAADHATTEPDTCAAFEGTWTGPFSVQLVDGATTATCSGTASITVDRSQSPALQGSFSCTLSPLVGGFAEVQTGLIDGWVNFDGQAGGTIEAIEGSVRDWTGTFTPSNATGSADGLQVDGGTAWQLDATWTLLP